MYSKDKVFTYKLILLYFVEQIDFPVNNNQIFRFVSSKDYMDYFIMQQCLAELVETEYFDFFRNDDTTMKRYTISEEGANAIKLFGSRISPDMKKAIKEYIDENRNIFRKEYEITANYFYDKETNEYFVKCCLYDLDAILMEISVSAVNKQTSRLICKNWKENVGDLYGEIFNKLINYDDENDNKTKNE